MNRNKVLFEEKQEINETLKKTVNNALKLDAEVERLTDSNKRMEMSIQERRKLNLHKVTTLNEKILKLDNQPYQFLIL